MSYSGSGNSSNSNKSSGFFKYSPTSWYAPDNYNRSTKPPDSQDAYAKAQEDAGKPLDVPSYKALDPEDAYDQALRFNNKVADRALIDIKDSSASAASNAKLAAQDKEFFDTRAKRIDQNIAQENALFNNNLKNRTASSFSQSFGLGGISNISPFTQDYNGARRINTSYASDQAAWNQQQTQAINDMARIAKAQNAGNVENIREQADAALRQSREDSINALNLANAQGANQRQLANISAASQEKIAQLQAQGGVFSSLFGGLSSGSQNYRYW